MTRNEFNTKWAKNIATGFPGMQINDENKINAVDKRLGYYLNDGKDFTIYYVDTYKVKTSNNSFSKALEEVLLRT